MVIKGKLDYGSSLEAWNEWECNLYDVLYEWQKYNYVSLMICNVGMQASNQMSNPLFSKLSYRPPTARFYGTNDEHDNS